MTEKVKLFKNILVHPKSLLLILLVTAIIVATSVIIELNQSKSEMLELMEKQGHSLLETLLTSSQHALLSYNKIEAEVKQRLLGNAVMIKLLYEKGLVNDDFLSKIANENKIFRINIFDSSGKKRFGSNKEVHIGLEPKNSPKDYLAPIFDGEADTIIIGIKPARFLDEQRYALAVAAKDRNAIVLNIDAKELLSFRQQVGFGVLLKNATENKQIVYAALQDEKGIIAGSGKISNLESIDSSELLKETIAKKNYKWQIAEHSGVKVFELLHPFIFEGKVIGVFRLGLSLEPLDKINDRLTRRLIFLGIIFLVFGFITLSMIFIRQNFDLLSKKFKVIESYSTQIIENVSDGIVVLDKLKKVKSINSAAKKLFNAGNKVIAGESFKILFTGSECDFLLLDESTIAEIECIIDGRKKILLISKSTFIDENHEDNMILVMRDLTEQKRLEEQIIRGERLTAMGELASSVAHEIRNPLNSIGTITQQLGKDYLPVENQDEYKSLTQIVYKEVRRINDTIESFLKFAKPKPIQPETFSLSDLLAQTENQYKEVFKQKNSNLIFSNMFNGAVFWDRTQIAQVFINLIENALDSLSENGTLIINSTEIANGLIEIKFSDNGKGISPDNLKKIFNLYFTTKTKGSGIGLSVVQQIISEHNGVISVESTLGQGTAFTIQLPKNI
ncbi:MAG: NtrC family signal transduction histidine kinase [Stygiobacter sp.]|nr:MAG: NtrC family signal transduction histidine kinase [Stygiobacter sp.]KAF0217861.1 MAG: NtrC family signal transduction histidine [Ignavibacteria bacterium]